VMSTIMTTANNALHKNAVMVPADEEAVIGNVVSSGWVWSVHTERLGMLGLVFWVKRVPGYRLRVLHSLRTSKLEETQ
jgi:hypothetical protein